MTGLLTPRGNVRQAIKLLNRAKRFRFEHLDEKTQYEVRCEEAYNGDRFANSRAVAKAKDALVADALKLLQSANRRMKDDS